MAEIKLNKNEKTMTIKLFWTDLTEDAQEQLREALSLEPNDDNNWTYIPMTVMEIER